MTSKSITSMLGMPDPKKPISRALQNIAAKSQLSKGANPVDPDAVTGKSGSYEIPKTKGEANKIVGGLSAPGKMPEGSYGISAFDCKTGSALRQIPGSVCSTCYAMKGQYTWPNVREAHNRRLDAVKEALGSNESRGKFIGAFVKLMDGKKHFRWHDSGDIQSPEHFGLIADIARATPDTNHWLPTKEPRFVKRYLAAGGDIPDNLVVRMSGPMNDGAPIQGFQNTSTVHKAAPPPAGSYVCPAKDQQGKCDGAKHGGTNCRKCWDKDTPNVSYPWH